MGTKARTALAALAGAAAITAGAAAFAGASSAAGTVPGPQTQAGQLSCVIDSSGYCTVQHYLGVVPEAVLVSPVTPTTGGSYFLSTVQGSYTATTFRVRAMVTQSTPKAAGQIWFSYAIYPPLTPPATYTPTPTPTDYTSTAPGTPSTIPWPTPTPTGYTSTAPTPSGTPTYTPPSTTPLPSSGR